MISPGLGRFVTTVLEIQNNKKHCNTFVCISRDVSSYLGYSRDCQTMFPNLYFNYALKTLKNEDFTRIKNFYKGIYAWTLRMSTKGSFIMNYRIIEWI